METLCKYLDNIINNPEEEKYQRIRLSNRVFSDKVQPIEGSNEVLFAAGFRQQKLTFNDQEEDFLIFDINNIENVDTLKVQFYRHTFGDTSE